MPDKKQLPANAAVPGLEGKSITGISVYSHGSVTVVEINYTGGPYYIKIKGFEKEVGGTNDWGTGRKL